MRYYDEKVVGKLVDDYLKTDRKGEEAKKIRDKIIIALQPLIKAIIFTHKFVRFENFDDIYQEMMVSCITALDRYDPEYITSKGLKVTTFNYFSLVCKNTGIYYTTKNKRNRSIYRIDDYDGNIWRTSDEDTVTAIKHICEGIDRINKPIGVRTGKNDKTLKLLKIYIQQTGMFHMSEFVKLCYAFGYPRSRAIEVVNTVRSNKHVFNTVEEISEIMSGQRRVEE